MNLLDYWKKDSIYADNRFCYEAIYPRASFSIIDAWTLIVKDLDKYLGVQSGIESRNVSCMKLVKMNSEQIPIAFSQRFSTDEIILADKNRQAVINGRNLDDFIRQLNSMKPDLPAIINETGYNGEVGVAFNGEDFKDLNSIKATLQKNGLNLIAGTAKMNVLVLKRVR